MNVAFFQGARESRAAVPWEVVHAAEIGEGDGSSHEGAVVIVRGKVRVPESPGVGDPEYVRPLPRLVLTRWEHLEGRDSDNEYVDDWRAPALGSENEWRATEAHVGPYAFDPKSAEIQGAPTIMLAPEDLVASPAHAATWDAQANRLALPAREGYATSTLVYRAISSGDEITLVGRAQGDALVPFRAFGDATPALWIEAGDARRSDAIASLARSADGVLWLIAGALAFALSVGGPAWFLSAALSAGTIPIFLGSGFGRVAFFVALGWGVGAAMAIAQLVDRGTSLIGIGATLVLVSSVALVLRFAPSEEAYESVDV